MIEKVTREEREQELLQKAKILYIAGNTNEIQDIAFLLERRFFSAGIVSTVIDNELIKQGLCKDCIDPTEIFRRSIEIAKLYVNSGIIAISYGSIDLISTINNHVENTDLIVITSDSNCTSEENYIILELDKSSLQEVVHSLYKKLASSISQ